MNNRERALEVVIQELERNLQTINANLSWLKQCVDTDELTRLLRRGAFMAKVSKMLKAAEAENAEVHLLMIDIDHFKKVNDSYGHQTGDVVLQRVSELIRSYLRPQDLAGRYGGEEIIVAIQADEKTAMQIAENIRNAVERAQMTSRPSGNSGAEFHVTLSVGVTSTQKSGYEVDVLISHADAALYRAKNSGRNRIMAAAPAPVQLASAPVPVKVSLSYERARPAAA